MLMVFINDIHSRPPCLNSNLEETLLTYREGRGRGLRKLEGYIALFVCFVTKAVHLEHASDQSTGTFVAVLNRFVSRRNMPRDLHSDNGGNFIGARNDLGGNFIGARNDLTSC